MWLLNTVHSDYAFLVQQHAKYLTLHFSGADSKVLLHSQHQANRQMMQLNMQGNKASGFSGSCKVNIEKKWAELLDRQSSDFCLTLMKIWNRTKCCWLLLSYILSIYSRKQLFTLKLLFQGVRRKKKNHCEQCGDGICGFHLAQA